MEEENREKEASLILHSMMLTNKRDLAQRQPAAVVIPVTGAATAGVSTSDQDEDMDVNVETDDEDSRDANLVLTAAKNVDSDEEVENKKKGQRKRRTMADYVAYGIDPSKLEESVDEVKNRFKLGCECVAVESNCFDNLNAELVYRHRLNIAELTKAEQDMYLMGVTMASLTNPETTAKQKERQRLRAQYVYQGKKVCLDAFLYLENCTHYQLKKIRKHVMTHGVVPRTHGNQGKKPHNTFSLDIYRHANNFIESYIEVYVTQAASQNKSKSTKKKITITLPQKVTRKTLHNEYKDYCAKLETGTKVMGYSSFRHFISEQFPNIRFTNSEVWVPKPTNVEVHEAPKVQEAKEAPPPQPQPQLQQPTITTAVMQPTIIMDGSSNTTFTTPAGNTYVIAQVLPTGFCQVPANFQTVSIDSQSGQATTAYTFNTT